ncbi:MAG TPA: hypothetical protein VJO13_08205 [Ktedonobacterales bacterium]|nr:hypothetical protein [Ktedonobacterales bacterium]
MIRIGLSQHDQRRVVASYLAEHTITRVVVFAPKAFPFAVVVPEGVAYQSFDYTDIILYKVFYPLLEVIDERTLLIFHACLRTRDRNDLTYNCAHHYANQTRHVIVFEPFPFLEDADDLMILLDYQTPGKYKGRGFDARFLADEDVRCARWPLRVETMACAVTVRDRERYEQKRRQLFDALGSGDPDTIPRQLHLFAGGFKRGAIQPDRRYVARNSRFKLPNVVPYRDVRAGEEYAAVDFPHRRIAFNDFLARTGQTTIRFLHTGLRVDEYYLGELRAWLARLETVYAATATWDEAEVSSHA